MKYKRTKRLLGAIGGVSCVLLLATVGGFESGDIGLLAGVILIAVFMLIPYICYKLCERIDRAAQQRKRRRKYQIIMMCEDEKRVA